MPHPAHDLCSSHPHRCVVVRVTSAMREHEEVLSLDLEESDYLYRIQCGKRVVYVSVLHADIVPPDHRTPAPTSWVGRGMALTARKSDGAVECSDNEFSPHALDSGAIAACAGRRFNVLELERRGRTSEGMAGVAVGGTVCVVKIARFKHELEALEREVRVYGAV